LIYQILNIKYKYLFIIISNMCDINHVYFYSGFINLYSELILIGTFPYSLRNGSQWQISWIHVLGSCGLDSPTLFKTEFGFGTWEWCDSDEWCFQGNWHTQKLLASKGSKVNTASTLCAKNYDKKSG